eukprot:6197540-Pleurochrysis_carterae.AAC.1
MRLRSVSVLGVSGTCPQLVSDTTYQKCPRTSCGHVPDTTWPHVGCTSGIWYVATASGVHKWYLVRAHSFSCIPHPHAHRAARRTEMRAARTRFAAADMKVVVSLYKSAFEEAFRDVTKLVP